MSVFTILDILDRAHTGPLCAVKDWDMRVIPPRVAEKLKDYHLQGTCTPEHPINSDDALADAFFKAGFELAVEVGMLCLNTERVIKVSEDELRSAIQRAPRELPVGEGRETVILRARQPEDPHPPAFTAPLGIVVSEDLWVPLMQGIVQNREVDIAQGGSLETVFGRPILSATPYETFAGRLHAQMHHEALWRAGRSGMPATAVISSTTEFGQLGGYGLPGGFKPTDIALVLSPAELKTTYTSLHKVVHALNCGGVILSGASSMIGGYSGPPEGAALSAIAFSLLQYVVHQCHCGASGVLDLRYMGNCGRHAQWTISVVFQALSRNTHLITNSVTNQVAGPGTEMLLYESAAVMLNFAVSGASIVIGPRSAGGKYANYLTPLECKFCGEVLKRSAGLKREQANEIVKILLAKYEDSLKDPPKGKSFVECFDLGTLQPAREWLDLYLKVKRELIDLGVPLGSAFS
ncbi:MAG: monomethylamine:corrinoid methyltransferase [Chloroflexi bacterium]|nr:monomethylamine:corrinoid methyltransferase [Chloroflexota bacterium]MCL5074308.1 monomethylamine:corrinoid methyltransferase [Chloroflexota bacterium]